MRKLKQLEDGGRELLDYLLPATVCQHGGLIDKGGALWWRLRRFGKENEGGLWWLLQTC